jgi:hypothetical protein
LDLTVELLEALVAREPALLRPQATYAAWAALDPAERVDFEERARAGLLALLTGPLVWFGVLDTPPPEPQATGRVGESAGLVSLRLTSLGAALLGREDGAWPADPDPAPLTVAPLLDQAKADVSSADKESVDEASVDEGAVVVLEAPAGLPPSDRFALEAIVPPDPDTPYRYHLTRAPFLRALQRGHTAEGVVNFLERAGGEPLSAPVLGALYRWEEDFNRVVVRQAILLQTRDPGLLADLTAQRRIRETLGRTLNARTVEVRADRLDALLRRLDWRGIIPRLDLTHSRLGPLPGKGGEVSDDERAAIAAALRVYAHVADGLGLPTRPAYALARRWSEGLPLALRDAVERTVERTLDALHRASPLETEDRLPEPTGPLLESLEAAIQERATVEIAYTTAGRAHRTTRRVEPLRLEWRGDVVYLVAYCHLRGDQRVFRVDRISRVEIMG